ncbi:adhesion G protein-coupled receptor L4-like [Branchiostoma floridae x Branchiostoma japonicum]
MELLKTNETSIDFQARKVDASNFSGLYYPAGAGGVDFAGCAGSVTNDSSAFFYLPSPVLERGNDQTAEVVNILFRDVPFLLEGENQTSVFSNGTVRSVLLSSSVYPPIRRSFSEPIKIKFLHEEIPADTYSRRCGFINNYGNANEGNQWSTEGCEVEESTDTCTICSCNHLTSFAILMQPVDLDLTDDQEGALWYITLVGSSISLLSLATTIFLLLFFGCWKTERSFLLMNLVLALMAAQVTFLAGINATSNQTTCRAVAILIHYFFLASFFWMMAHGIQLFFKVKSVFSATRDRRVEFFLFGWINPGAIVIVTSGVKPDGYEMQKYCWLSTDDGMVYAFIGPVLFIIVVNFFILFFVIKTFMSIKANCKKSDIQKTKYDLRISQKV